MLKKIFIFIFASLVLISCGSDDGTLDSNSNGVSVYDKENFSIIIPSNWEIIENKEDILPKPSDGTIELAVVSKDFVNSFRNNLLILSDKLKIPVTSRDFSIKNNLGASEYYQDYLEFESKEIEFQNGDKSILYVFEARYNSDTPKLKFLQTSQVCSGTNAYLLTISIPTSVNDTSKYVELLKTFKCKGTEKVLDGNL